MLWVQSDFYRIWIHRSGFLNLDPDLDPGGPKRLDLDPDPPYEIFDKPYYVWDVLPSFKQLMTLRIKN